MTDVRGELSAMKTTVRTAAGTLARGARTVASLLRDRAKASVARGVARVKKAGQRTGWRRV